jgi:hypothetical protein
VPFEVKVLSVELLGVGSFFSHPIQRIAKMAIENKNLIGQNEN